MIQESKAYRISLFPLPVFLACMLFMSCAPVPASSAKAMGSGKAKRTVVMLCATWCNPCTSMKKDVLPALEAKGIKVARFSEKAEAHIHLVDVDKDADPRPGWKITSDILPAFVIFEGQNIVETKFGPQDATSLLTMLERRDLADESVPAKPADVAHVTSDDDGHQAATPGPLRPVPASSNSTWDRLTEFLGTDTVSFTLSVPNGRRIPIEAANAAAILPDRLTGHARLVGESIQVDFDQPLVKAEGKRFGIRVGTTIPSVTITREQATVHTGLGLPFKITSPFSAMSAELATGSDAADGSPESQVP